MFMKYLEFSAKKQSRGNNESRKNDTKVRKYFFQTGKNIIQAFWFIKTRDHYLAFAIGNRMLQKILFCNRTETI